MYKMYYSRKAFAFLNDPPLGSGPRPCPHPYKREAFKISEKDVKIHTVHVRSLETI